MIVPWKVDVPQDRWPIVNWLIIAGIVAAFVAEAAAIAEYVAASRYQPRQPGPPSVMQYVLTGWTLKGLFGHMWLHGGIWHLLGNVFFLWLFGNAVCARVGNLRYLGIYLALGLIAAVTHLVFVGGRAIGASGAINGVIGMFLVFFPENEIDCYWIFPFPPWIHRFSVSSYWMILLWFGYDLVGVFFAGAQVGGTAYVAHVGGFAGGFAVAVVLLKTRLVVMEPGYEKSLLQLFGDRRYARKPSQVARHQFQQEVKPVESAQVHKTDTSRPQAPTPRRAAPTREGTSFTELPDGNIIHFVCPCGRRVKVSAKYAGKTGQCPRCGKKLRIPNERSN